MLNFLCNLFATQKKIANIVFQQKSVKLFSTMLSKKFTVDSIVKIKQLVLFKDNKEMMEILKRSC